MIEDIDYLKKHSMKESYIIMIDSKNRNKSVYSTPENYRINFETPFTHVYSVEVLDASIPRTQYSVDDHNNTLRLNAYSTNVKYVYQDNANFITMKIPIGDYNNVNLISTINTVLNENNIDIILQNVSSPANINSTFEFISPHKFELDMYSSTINTVLGFDMYNNGVSNKYTNFKNFNFPSSGKDIYMNQWITDNRYVSTFQNRWFGSLISEDDRISFLGFESPTNIGESYENSTNMVIIQPFYISDDSLYSSGYVNNIDLELLEGSYTWTIKSTLTNDTSGDTIIEKHDYSVKKQLFTDVIYYIYFYFTSSNGNFMVNVATGSSDETSARSSDNNILTIDDSNFQLNFSLTLYKKTHKIIAPGMHNLLGERYVMLRCKEVEEHLFKFRSYESYSMGMAKFKLSVQGFEDERFDFSSIPPREFHPIGKLPCLSFEFFNPDGSYYNFRGVNHTLTLIIRYYTPTRDPEIFKSKLNPEYDPDIFKYIQEKGFNTDSDSEDSN